MKEKFKIEISHPEHRFERTKKEYYSAYSKYFNVHGEGDTLKEALNKFAIHFKKRQESFKNIEKKHCTAYGRKIKKHFERFGE